MANQVKLFVQKDILQKLIKEPMSMSNIGLKLISISFVNRFHKNELQAIIVISLGTRVFNFKTKTIYEKGTLKPLINKHGAIFTEQKPFFED